MTHALRIAHLRIALHVANPEVGNREVHQRKDTNKKRCHNKKDAKKITNEAKHVQFSGTRQLITQWHVRTLNTTSKYELLL